jgi:hypothetical protein
VEIDWDYNLLGTLSNFLLKTGIPYVYLINTDNTEMRYRFVHKVAGNGLFVSKQVFDMEDLHSVFSGSFVQDISGIRISGSGIFYKRNVRVTFYAAPRT